MAVSVFPDLLFVAAAHECLILVVHLFSFRQFLCLLPVLLFAQTPNVIRLQSIPESNGMTQLSRARLPPTTTLPVAPFPLHPKKASIFVSIVSFRDPETNPTILDLFDRASNPSRVSVGLVWQLDLDVAQDENMRRATPATGSSCVRGGSVRSLLMPAADAAGPSWARRAAQTLWKGEKYFLQIDSHTRFRPG